MFGWEKGKRETVVFHFVSFQCFINEIYQFLLLMKKIVFTKFSVSNTINIWASLPLKLRTVK